MVAGAHDPAMKLNLLAWLVLSYLSDLSHHFGKFAPDIHPISH
jgi:hypothetical protein